MKYLIQLLLTAISFLVVSCNQPDGSAEHSTSPATSRDLSKKSQPFEIGPIISTIDFKVKAMGEDLQTFEDGFIPWISIDDPKAALNKLVDADKIVLPFKTAIVIIDYPLNSPDSFEIKTKGEGFSRKQLVLEISSRYHEIYKLEETTATTKTIPADKRKGLANRNQTDGKYGVWGHDLSDLDLSEIEVHKNSNGEITLTLGIES